MKIKEKYQELSEKVKKAGEKDKNRAVTAVVLIFLGIMLLMACKSITGMFEDASSSDVLPSAVYSADIRNTETRLSEILSQAEGVGKADVMVNYLAGSGNTVVDGIIIVCDGGQNPETIVKITGSIQALMDIPAKRIKILARSKK